MKSERAPRLAPYRLRRYTARMLPRRHRAESFAPVTMGHVRSHGCRDRRRPASLPLGPVAVLHRPLRGVGPVRNRRAAPAIVVGMVPHAAGGPRDTLDQPG